MSAWKIAVRALYGQGGTATLEQIQMSVGGIYISDGCLRVAIGLGLVTSNAMRGGNKYREKATYVLTQKGWLWSQGKLTDGRGIGTAKSRKALGFMATWLLALPEGIHVTETRSFWQQLCISCGSHSVLYYPDKPETMLCSPCVTASFTLLLQRSATTVAKNTASQPH